ncbi:unnamed protein product [Blumeria hordei]|uniref:Pyrroline-5-carboxylate reductase n=1 Tax=Blumeria hordei TaxID=2867405 RepID=A0A383UU47_BLUHO|nr:unnamed protein product [Blumeria hordei]
MLPSSLKSYENSSLNNVFPKGMTISVIGCGALGSAILSRLMDACENMRKKSNEAPFDRFFATVSCEESRSSLLSRFSEHQTRFRAYCGENDLWMDAADIVVLAFRPCMIDKILSQKGVRDALAGKLVISLLDETPRRRLENAISISESSAIGEKRSSLYSSITYVPNEKPPYLKCVTVGKAVEHGKAVTVIETPPIVGANETFEKMTRWIFNQCGKTIETVPENFGIGSVLSAASAVSLSVAVDGILDAAVSQGLERAQAREIVGQSLISLGTLLQNNIRPSDLREEACRPQGSTMAGLISLEEDRARWAFCKAIITDSERSKQIILTATSSIQDHR